MRIIDRINGLEMSVTGATAIWKDRGSRFASVDARTIVKSTPQTFSAEFRRGLICPDASVVRKFMAKYECSLLPTLEQMRVDAEFGCRVVVRRNAINNVRSAVSAAMGIVPDKEILDIVNEAFARNVHKS